MKQTTETYPWKFASVGGTVRVKIQSGEDIRHLGELDRKMWTVLSCPTEGLEFDSKTLKYIDVDADGRIRVDEVVRTAQWLTQVIKDADLLLKGNDVLEFSAINEEDPVGARLLSSARQILKNLGLKKDSISVEDTSDYVKIFADTKFNGDGIITPASAGSDEALAELIKTISGIASAVDRSGVPGITIEHIEAFYAACADFKAWKDAGTKDVFPFGDKTADALAAVEALKCKVADYFMRCKLIGFDGAVAGALDVSVDKIAAIEGNLADATDKIAEQPLAKPSADGILHLDAVNPAWKGAVDAMKALVDAPAKLDEAAWNEIVAKFAPYTAWLGAKKGAEVEALGLDAVNEILKADKKAALIDLIEKDKAEEANALSIEEVGKLVSLYQNFNRFLNNYVVLADFYDPNKKAIFQAGRLYIDQRSTDLCIKVKGPSPEISSLSGMYILYCACTCEKLGKSFNIAAVLTDGDVDGLREGKNGVFYDREGNDYTAKVTAIVDNPISIRQAFWAPYKKVARMINDRIDKAAAEKNDKSMAGLTEKANAATTVKVDGNGADAAKAMTSSFDIAKFAGIFAAIGMAIGFIGQFLVAVIKGAAALKFWQLILVIVGIMLLISGPSMFIAWRKLRKRDLGPVLNANGWAINAKALVRVKFGKTLTSMAKFPKLTAVDAEAHKKMARRRFWSWFCGIAVVALVVLWLLNIFAPKCPSPLPCYKTVEAVEEVTAEEPTEAPAEAPVEAPADPAVAQ